MPEDSLQSVFPQISKSDWLDQIKKDLKNRSLPSTEWTIDDEVTISPFQHSDDKTVSLTLAGVHELCTISQTFQIKDYSSSENQSILNCLAQGVNSIELHVHSEGLLEDWNALLKDVHIPFIRVSFTSDTFDRLETSFLEWDQYVTLMNYNKDELSGSFHFIGDQEEVKPILNKWGEVYPKFSFLTITETSVENDKSKVQANARLLDLTWRLLSGCTSSSWSMDRLISQVRWNLISSRTYFVEVARLRALHWNWALLLEGEGINEFVCPFIQYSITEDLTHREKSLIAATTQAISGWQGGIDEITIRFESKTEGTLAQQYERLGWNISHLLQLESHFDQVQDPVSGSYFFEQLTEQIARKSWNKLA